jgi:hypothetical protein
MGRVIFYAIGLTIFGPLPQEIKESNYWAIDYPNQEKTIDAYLPSQLERTLQLGW